MLELQTSFRLFSLAYLQSSPAPFQCEVPAEDFMTTNVANNLKNTQNLAQLVEQWRRWLPTHPLEPHNATHPCRDWLRFKLLNQHDSHRVVIGAFCTRFRGNNYEFLIEFTRTPSDQRRHRSAPFTFSGDTSFCVSEGFKRNHHTSTFIFSADGRAMRLSRWDRAGIIYTTAFDYTTDGGRTRLRDILWSLSRLSATQAGYDPTAIRLPPAHPQYALMTYLAKDAANDISDEDGAEVNTEGPHIFRYVREAFADSLSPNGSRYKLIVPQEGGTARSYLVGEPKFAATGVHGRGTRGYVAWDLEEGEFVWLKDAWRPDYHNVRSEASTLRYLASKGVQGIPTLVCEADLDQYTETTNFKAMTSAQIMPYHPSRAADFQASGDLAYRHYRFVEKEVCRSLYDVKNSREHVSVVRDCVRVHCEATRKAFVLHRDISGGNLLVHPVVIRNSAGKRVVVRRGILADWEMAEPVDDHRDAVPWYRRGTYMFTSVRLLSNAPQRPSRVEDELEAFFHVHLYAACRLFHNTFQDLPRFRKEYFFDSAGTSERPMPSDKKQRTILRSRIPSQGNRQLEFLDSNGTTSHPLNDLSATFLGMVSSHYHKDKCLLQTMRGEHLDWLRTLGHQQQANEWEAHRSSMITSHDPLLSLLDAALERQDWPGADKVPYDQFNPPFPPPVPRPKVDVKRNPPQGEPAAISNAPKDQAGSNCTLPWLIPLAPPPVPPVLRSFRPHVTQSSPFPHLLGETRTNRAEKAAPGGRDPACTQRPLVAMVTEHGKELKAQQGHHRAKRKADEADENVNPVAAKRRRKHIPPTRIPRPTRVYYSARTERTH